MVKKYELNFQRLGAVTSHLGTVIGHTEANGIAARYFDLSAHIASSRVAAVPLLLSCLNPSTLAPKLFYTLKQVALEGRGAELRMIKYADVC